MVLPVSIRTVTGRPWSRALNLRFGLKIGRSELGGELEISFFRGWGVFGFIDRILASAPNTIEVVKISIPRGLFLILIS